MKKLTVLLLALFMIGGSTLAFAWWDNLTNDENTVTIGVGDGVTLNVVANAFTTDALVPSGVVAQTGQTDTITITFNVDLDKTVDEELNLAVLVDNVQINNNATLGSDYVVTVVTNPGLIQNDTVTVTIVVTLNMNQDTPSVDVEAVKNQNITFDVTFTASQN